jgi:hypothetical protein
MMMFSSFVYPTGYVPSTGYVVPNPNEEYDDYIYPDTYVKYLFHDDKLYLFVQEDPDNGGYIVTYRLEAENPDRYNVIGFDFDVTPVE